MMSSTILRSQSAKTRIHLAAMINLYHSAPRHHSVVQLASLCKKSGVCCTNSSIKLDKTLLVCCQRTVSSHTFPAKRNTIANSEYQTVHKANHSQPKRFFSVNMYRTPLWSNAKKAISPTPQTRYHPHSPSYFNAATTIGNLQTWRAFSTTRSRNTPRGTMLVEMMGEEKRKEKLVEMEEERKEEKDVAMAIDEDGVVADSDAPARPHTPVMLTEVLNFLDPKENQVFLDMTFGAGGHTEAILQQCDTSKVLALDRDPVAIELANTMAEKYGKDRLLPLLGRFSSLSKILKKQNISLGSLDGVLIDAGSSSMQFDTAERGFALSRDGPLDMRMDGNRITNQPTAADYVNTLDAPTLANILHKYGEEPRARKIAKTIVDYREKYRPIQTTKEFATVVSFAFTHSEAGRSKDSLGRHAHVATKTFLALRILVNNELHELNEGLKQIEMFVKPGGRLAAISFHSMEDRIVKRFLQGRDVTEKAKSLHRKKAETSEVREEDSEVVMESAWDMEKDLQTASKEEIEMNPRSRSAKLRTAVKL
ncbi:12S rRNA N(4)-cytidine methyltransferase METTL15-like isoform X2 [Amphiura filiformis]